MKATGLGHLIGAYVLGGSLVRADELPAKKLHLINWLSHLIAFDQLAFSLNCI